MQGLETVRLRIAKACIAAGRNPADVRLLAVAKRHPAASIRALHALGQHCFGENQFQEAAEKQALLADLDIEWHFIGSIQSNKTRGIAAGFDWVQSVDREKVLRRLSEYRPEQRGPLQICLQVNIDFEPQKSGMLPDQVSSLADLAVTLPGLKLRGLMAIPRPSEDIGQTRDSFARVAALYRQLQSRHPGIDTLSIGMSSDLEAAIASGSTMVRIGTDLFGPRP